MIFEFTQRKGEKFSFDNILRKAKKNEDKKWSHVDDGEIKLKEQTILLPN